MHDTAYAPPSLGLLGCEPLRAAFEYLSHQFARERIALRGDGHPVIVFPGLATDKQATAPLRSFCEKLGYEVHDWGRGLNTGPQGDVHAWLDELADHIATLLSTDEPMSLVGWSLGGIYAREVAKRHPQRVRQVITIGTPFAGTPQMTHASLLYRWVNGSVPIADDALLRRLRTAPTVPTTSIYSRTDGVVAWQACIQPGHCETIQNLEVDGSHCGLPWNSQVLRIVADRLAQPAQAWRRYPG